MLETVSPGIDPVLKFKLINDLPLVILYNTHVQIKGIESFFILVNSNALTRIYSYTGGLEIELPKDTLLTRVEDDKHNEIYNTPGLLKCRVITGESKFRIPSDTRYYHGSMNIFLTIHQAMYVIYGQYPGTKKG